MWDIPQDEEKTKPVQGMGSLMSRFKPVKNEKKKGIHTPAHELAVELATFYSEPKKVGFWLGVIKRFGIEGVRVQWKGMADSRAPNSAGLLLFMLKKKRDEYIKRNASNADGEVQGAENKPATK